MNSKIKWRFLKQPYLDDFRLGYPLSQQIEYEYFNFESKKNSPKPKSLPKIQNKKNLVENFIQELDQHPLILNPLIEAILPEKDKKKHLNYLDPELFPFKTDSDQDEDDEEEDNVIISKLFEKNENKNQSIGLSSTSINIFKSKLEELIDLETPKPILPKLKETKAKKVYTYEHFKWLFSQGNEHKLIKFGNFKNEKLGTNRTKVLNNLEMKILEFCKWAENKYDCKELELDAITLMKIFLVNYDKGPLMWVPVNIEEVTNFKGLPNTTNNLISNSNESLSKSKEKKKSIFQLKKAQMNMKRIYQKS